jgi:hypothetical protein
LRQPRVSTNSCSAGPMSQWRAFVDQFDAFIVAALGRDEAAELLHDSTFDARKYGVPTNVPQDLVPPLMHRYELAWELQARDSAAVRAGFSPDRWTNVW